MLWGKGREWCEVVAEWLGGQGDFNEDTMRRKHHVKSWVKIFRAKEQPRQRPGGGKEQEIMKRRERSSGCLPSQKKRVMWDNIGCQVGTRWCGTSQATMRVLSLVNIQWPVPGRLKWGPTWSKFSKGHCGHLWEEWMERWGQEWKQGAQVLG